MDQKLLLTSLGAACVIRFDSLSKSIYPIVSSYTTDLPPFSDIRRDLLPYKNVISLLVLEVL